MSNRNNRARRVLRRPHQGRTLRPLVEVFEPRVVLSGNGFLQGTVFVDANHNSLYDPQSGDAPIPGALVQAVQDNVVKGAATTDSKGNYLITGLDPGTYQLVETPPTGSGMANQGVQINSPLNPATLVNAGTINVRVNDLSALTVTYDGPTELTTLNPAGVYFKASPDNGVTYVTENYMIGQMPITVSGPGLSTPSFSSDCVAVFSTLNYGVDPFTASGQPLSTALVPATNAAAIGYLYEQYGYQSPPTTPTSTQILDFQALQLAIWKLLYDSGPALTDFSAGNIKDVTIDTDVSALGSVHNPSLSDLEGRALQFIQEGINYAQPAIELVEGKGPNGVQSVLAPGMLNFSNTKAAPLVTTTAGATAGGVGVAMLSDSATVAGGLNPTGTITFTLTAPDGTTTQVGQPVAINGDGTYQSPAVLATEAGTYTWHAVYNGDVLNNGAIDDGTNESVMIVQAAPVVNTQQQPATAVVGTMIADKATVSGGDNPTGTVTFALYDNPNGTGTPLVIDTEPLVGGIAVSAGYLATSTGTNYWVATYNGDANNATALSGTADEPVVVTPASPKVATQASETAGGVVGTSVLGDRATVSGTYHGTGLITFTLTAPDGSTTTVGTVAVAGDGTYDSPTVVATQVGSYTWHASYAGDGLNDGAIDDGTNESLSTVKASPAISTRAMESSNVVGTAILVDRATVVGSYQGTGTITFTLTAPDGSTTTVGTSAVAGDGTYSSPTVLATQVGTYTWHATYNGDALNNGAVDDGTNESVATVKASPRVATQAGNTGSYAPGVVPLDGATYLTDAVTVSGGLNPGGSVTFTLTGPGGPIASATQVVSIHGDGTYATPKGYLPTAPGTYTWHATYAGDSLNNQAADDGTNESETVIAITCCATNVSYTVTTAGGKSTVVSDLRGNTHQGDTVTANFTVPAGHYDQLSLVSYNAPESWFNSNDAKLQTVYQTQTGVFGPGTYSLTVTLPNNFYQVDFVCGPVIAQLGLDSNDFYGAQNRLRSADNGGVNPQGQSQVVVSGIAFCDQNNNGVYNSGEAGIPGATVKLTGLDAFGNSVSYTTTTDAKGNYSFGGLPQSSASGYTVAVTPPSGDYAGKAAVGTAGGKVLTTGEGVSGIVVGTGLDIYKGLPNVTTSPSNGATTNTASSNNFGIIRPDDSISGTVYADGNNNGTFSAGDVGLAGVTVTLNGTNFLGAKVTLSTKTDGNGNYTFGGLLPGTYAVSSTPLGGFTATKANVGAVNGSSDGQATCSTTIGSITLGGSCLTGTGYNFAQTGSCVGTGDTATIGFWAHKGQALILGFNGGGSSTALGHWLASTMPNLFGDLANANNQGVADEMVALFKLTGQPTYAQILAAALAVYATDTNLGGNATASADHFNVDANGTGASTFNVGSYGSALGLTNSKSYSVFDLLVSVDKAANANGTLTGSAFNAANSLFSKINQAGDITG